jgi:predicted AAA+ superfamily ATPase
MKMVLLFLIFRAKVIYMERLYNSIIREHFSNNRQMAFISGPRQVGKTTLSKSIDTNYRYLDWDDTQDRISIIQGQQYVVDRIGQLANQLIIFDELHKYPDWKNFVKGLFDKYQELGWKIIVTGSSRLDTYRKGGDSLTGRYFHFQMHPLSVAELLHTNFSEKLIRKQKKLQDDDWNTLLSFGGFPEPFLKANRRFHRQWSRTRQKQLVQEDIRGLGGGYDISRIEVLSELIHLNATTLLNYSSYARNLRASVESVQRWIILLEQLSYCFLLRPWTKNISRSIAKEPKIFLVDWSQIDNAGKRNENFVASSLLKAVQGWNDLGLGNFSLHFIRTKEKREVDFVVTDNNQPWFLVEVKSSEKSLNPNLEYFQKMIGAKHAFQVTMNLPYQDLDCFSIRHPVVVPAMTLLSQLL